MITRCKECVYSKRTLTDEYKCVALDTDGLSSVWLDANDFCSKGRSTYAEGCDNGSIIEQLEKDYLEKRKEVIGV